jgi:hypothetical protein
MSVDIDDLTSGSGSLTLGQKGAILWHEVYLCTVQVNRQRPSQTILSAETLTEDVYPVMPNISLRRHPPASWKTLGL